MDDTNAHRSKIQFNARPSSTVVADQPATLASRTSTTPGSSPISDSHYGWIIKITRGTSGDIECVIVRNIIQGFRRASKGGERGGQQRGFLASAKRARRSGSRPVGSPMFSGYASTTLLWQPRVSGMSCWHMHSNSVLVTNEKCTTYFYLLA